MHWKPGVFLFLKLSLLVIHTSCQQHGVREKMDRDTFPLLRCSPLKKASATYNGSYWLSQSLCGCHSDIVGTVSYPHLSEPLSAAEVLRNKSPLHLRQKRNQNNSFCKISNNFYTQILCWRIISILDNRVFCSKELPACASWQLPMMSTDSCLPTGTRGETCSLPTCTNSETCS